MYTAFAFGASVGGGPASHCYPLNGNFADPRVAGAAGIVAAYRAMLANCRLSGPTNFAPVINAAIASAQAARSRYACLLILTDGEITDMDKTLACVFGDWAGWAALTRSTSNPSNPQGGRGRVRAANVHPHRRHWPGFVQGNGDP